MHHPSSPRWLALVLGIALTLLHGTAQADRVPVALAANFAVPLKELAVAFKTQTGHDLDITAASTGKLYAQIRAGAPFAVLLSADVTTPQKLEAEGKTVAGTRFTYAIGRLALWSPKPGLVDAQGKVLETGQFAHLALANAKLAPYGLAAETVLQGLGVYDRLQAKLVRGENIAQTYQFVSTGAAELGFVAQSQIWQDGKLRAGSAWLIPAVTYPPLRQDGVLLKDQPAARALLDFLKSASARSLIQRFGYDLPPS